MDSPSCCAAGPPTSAAPRLHSAATGLRESPVAPAVDKTHSEGANGGDCSGPPGGGTPSACSAARPDYLSWDDYFMSVAVLSAGRSKDPCTQVGACVVNGRNRIVAIGYNGFPTGCGDDQLPWAKSADDPLDTKYPYVCHAEQNAILNKNCADVEGCTLYTVLFPCNECAKLIIQAGIKQVIYMRDKPSKPEMVASRRMLNMAKVALRPFVAERKQPIVISLVE